MCPFSFSWTVYFGPDAQNKLYFFYLAAALGEKLICFSQSLGTLDVLEKFIKEDKNLPQEEPWSRRIWRIDGKSNSIDREKIIRDFSDYHQVLIRVFDFESRVVRSNRPWNHKMLLNFEIKILERNFAYFNKSRMCWNQCRCSDPSGHV